MLTEMTVIVLGLGLVGDLGLALKNDDAVLGYVHHLGGLLYPL